MCCSNCDKAVRVYPRLGTVESNISSGKVKNNYLSGVIHIYEISLIQIKPNILCAYKIESRYFHICQNNNLENNFIYFNKWPAK